MRKSLLLLFLWLFIPLLVYAAGDGVKQALWLNGIEDIAPLYTSGGIDNEVIEHGDLIVINDIANGRIAFFRFDLYSGASEVENSVIAPDEISDGNAYTGDGRWILNDFYGSNINVSGAIDAGGATSLEIPNSDDPDVDAAGEISWDTDGWMRAYDGSAQVAIARKLEEIHVTVVAPNDLDDAVRDKFVAWSNESGMSFIVTGWKAWSGTDNTEVNIEEYDADGQNNATVDAVNIQTDGTGIYTASDTSITGATIENGHLIALDFDDTDTPTYVKITIYGYYNADVN